MKAFHSVMPEVFAGYAQMKKAAMVEGELSVKHKEIIALVVSVIKHCDGCIADHAKAAARLGATRGEVAEALAVTMPMHGGPGAVYSARAYEAFCEAAG
jgi:AhpD family alkylhydroperoxidase